MKNSRDKAVRLFVLVLVCVALAGGLSNKIFSNYFKEVYEVTSAQRGFIEIPRESPGILCMVFVAALGFLGNIRLAILAQLMTLIGITVMGFLSPSYGIMLIFLFLNSAGEHLFMPLNDSISMSLAKEGEVGTTLGKFKGVSTAGSLVAACAVFIGFRVGIFSFGERVILPFAIASGLLAAAVVLLIWLDRLMPGGGGEAKSSKLLIKKDYLPYYMITLAYGCQKRIRIVFAPWVIIELLHQGADVTALLTIAVHMIGIVVAPLVGRLLDRLGVKKMLLVEAGYMVAAFCIMGTLAGQLASGSFQAGGFRVVLVYAGYVLCMLFDHFGMVHSMIVRNIAKDPSEVTKTLSVGLGVDHVMAIIASPLLGIVWDKAGAQYVFYVAALSVLVQIAMSRFVREKKAAVS